MANEWTPTRISALIALWNEGLSTSEIGNRLGITKNAVVGKVHRLGLPKRNAPVRHKAEKEVVAEVIKPEALRPGMCSWPIGEPGTLGFGFCGQEAAPDRPYCAAHCSRAYVKITKDGKKVEAA